MLVIIHWVHLLLAVVTADLACGSTLCCAFLRVVPIRVKLFGLWESGILRNTYKVLMAINNVNYWIDDVILRHVIFFL